MPHDFTNEINAAFAAFESERAKLVALPPIRFESGPYYSPPVQIGDWVECARFGSVRIIGWSEGPLPWPQCRRSSSPSMVLFADLERAVKCESVQAVALAWGVWGPMVSVWRRVLKVKRMNAGTYARWQENISASISPQQHLEGLQRAHQPEAIALANEVRRAHGHIGSRHEWSEEEVSWLGVLTDQQVGKRLSLNKLTVAKERRRREIPTTGPIGHGSNLLPLNSEAVRARRLALGLTQPEVAARIGRGRERVKQLESGETARVKTETMEALSCALECQPEDLLASDTNKDANAALNL